MLPHSTLSCTLPTPALLCIGPSYTAARLPHVPHYNTSHNASHTLCGGRVGHQSSLPFLCTAAGLAWEMDQLHVCSTSTQNWDGEPHRALSVPQCKLIHSRACINSATCCLLQGTPPGCREMSAAVLASQCCPTVHNGCEFLGWPRGAGERTFPSTLHHCLPCDANPPHQPCHTRCFISTAVPAVIQVLPTVIPPESSQSLHTS